MKKRKGMGVFLISVGLVSLGIFWKSGLNYSEKIEIVDEQVPLSSGTAESNMDFNRMVYTLEDFGGRANDGAWDNSEALESAIQALNGKNRILVLGNGVYTFLDTVEISDKIESLQITGVSVGESKNHGTILSWKGDGYLFEFLNGMTNSGISTMLISCDGNYGISLEKGENSSIQDVFISNGLGALKIASYENLYIENMTYLTGENAEFAVLLDDQTKNSRNIYFNKCSFDGKDIAHCDAITINGGTDIYFSDSDICNWLTGKGIYFKQSLEGSNSNIYFDEMNIARCDGGIVLDAKQNIKAIIRNLSLIFRGSSSSETGLIFQSENPDAIQAYVLGLHTRKISSVKPAYIIYDVHAVTADSKFEIAQNLADGQSNVKNTLVLSEDMVTDLVSDNEKNMQNIQKQCHSFLLDDLVREIKKEKTSITGIYYFEDFGAQADDIYDNSEALEDALKFMSESGGILIFEDGNYSFETPISCSYRLRGVQFIGGDHTTLKWNGIGDFITFEREVWWCSFYNINILCQQNNAFRFNGTVYKSRLSDISIKNCLEGIRMGGFAYAFLDQISIEVTPDDKAKALAIGTNTDAVREFIYVENCDFYGNNEKNSLGVTIESGTHIYLNQCNFYKFIAGNGIQMHRQSGAPMLSMIYFNKINVEECNTAIEIYAGDYIGTTFLSDVKVDFSGEGEDKDGIVIHNENNKTIQIWIRDYNVNYIEEKAIGYVLKATDKSVQYTSSIEIGGNIEPEYISSTNVVN